MIDFAGINKAALAACPGLLQQAFPGGIVKGREFICGGFDGASGRSLSINMQTGVWADFASDARGGDLISLWAAAFHAQDQGAAAKALGRLLGLYTNGWDGPAPRLVKAPIAKKADAPADDWTPFFPPEGASAPNLSGFDSVHEYKSSDGYINRYVGRIEARDGKRKTFIPWTYGTHGGKPCWGGCIPGEEGWHQKQAKFPRSLYGLDRLFDWPDQTVVICEGEKSADAAQKFFPRNPCITWTAGTAGISRADWSPLEGRRIIIWPDNDEPGRKAAAELLAVLKPIAGKVAVLRVDDILDKDGNGGDAADIHLDSPMAWLMGRVDWSGPGLPGGEVVYPEIDYDKPIVYDETAEEPARDKPGNPGLPFTTFASTQPHLDVADFVEGLLTEGTMSVIYGESNSGKTFFASDIAMRVAAGMSWRDREVEQGAVLYLALEGGFGIANRITAFREEHGLDTQDVPFAVVTLGVTLFDPDKDAEPIIYTIRAVEQKFGFKLKLVVVDTLSRAMGGGNENASEDMTSLVRTGDLIRQETSAHLCWIHHSGKDAAKGARGHSSLRAAIDTEIEITAEGNSRRAEAVKQRDMECVGDFPFTLKVVELGVNRRGKPVTSCVVLPEDQGAETSAPAAVRLPKGNSKRAFEVLCDLIAASGISFGRADAPKSVPEKWWRDQFYDRGMPGAEPEARKKAFQRAAADLLDRHLIGTGQDRVWLPRRVEEGLGNAS